MLERKRWRFTVDDYHRMAEAGILGEDDRVELIDGEIVEMSPIGSAHTSCVKRLNHLFWQRVGGAAIVSVQDPIRLDDRSEPQPDVALLRPHPSFYADRHPMPADVLLVVEVADTSIEEDRRVKVPLYARGGIPEVWLVGLARGTVVTYQEPAEGGYRVVQTHRRGESLRPTLLPDVRLTVDEILG